MKGLNRRKKNIITLNSLRLNAGLQIKTACDTFRLNYN